MKKNILMILTASLGLAAATTQAATTIFAKDPTGTWVVGGTDATFGTPFSVGGSPMTITSLGFFDETGDGLASAHMVGIYNSASNLLGSVEVPAGNSPAYHDRTRWEPLVTAITLSANTTYMLAATMLATGDRGCVGFAGNITIGNGFTLAGPGLTYNVGTTLQYPASFEFGPVYAFGANMEAGEAAVPEPGQWAMMGMTLAGAAGFAIRRHRASKQ